MASNQKPPLGRLTQVDLREYWEGEATEFTPWMAQADNLALLGDAINIGLELQGTETSVGPFSADVVCKNTTDDSIVLIENQLEKTDHRHLGQILTYAAGVGAKTVVWVAKEFTEQHRAAIDWINRITNDDFEAYGVVVELWRIDDSAPAPRFHVVAKPNDWSRVVREQARHADADAAPSLYFEYWQGFCDHLEAAGSKLRAQSPSTAHWMNLSIGRSGVHFTTTVSTRDGFVTAQLYFERPGAAYYHQLLGQRREIDAELGELPVWDHKEGRASCSIHYKRDADPSNRTTWPELFRWTREKLELLDRVLRSRVAALPKARSTDLGGDE
jgi:hypothetical protein